MTIELKTLVFSQYRSQGNDIRIRAWDFESNGIPIGIQPMKSLEDWAVNNSMVEDFAWVSYHLYDLSPSRTYTGISNLGNTMRHSMEIYGASPNILDVCLPDYFIPDLWNENSPFTIGQQLYTPKGMRGSLLGSYYETDLGLTTLQSNFSIDVTTSYPVQMTKRYIFQPIAFAEISPIFRLTHFPVGNQDMVLSLDTMLQLTDGQYSSVSELPMRYMVIKLKDGLTDEQKDDVIESIPYLQIGQIQDLRNEVFGLVKQKWAIELTFQLVTLFAMTISFFSLNSSMLTNIMEQSKEIGILRALGLSKLKMFRIYAYEAFILVISAALLGSVVGVIVGWSIAAQRAMFTQVPLTFDFPWALVGTVTFASTLCALFSTVIPVYRLVKLQVVEIMRHN